MADIINSLKVANRLKEENRNQYIGNPASLQATLGKKGWTKAMVDELANMLKSAPALTKNHKQKNKEDSSNTDFEILKNFYNEVSSNPAKYGISKFNTEGEYGNLYNEVMTGKSLRGFIKHLIPVIPANLPPAVIQQNTELAPVSTLPPAVIQQQVTEIAEVEKEDQQSINNEAEEADSNPTEGQSSFFIFPANPFLPGVDDFKNIIDSMASQCKGSFPIVMISDQGADGAFDVHCFDSFKSHKLGASSEFKKHCVLTSFKTFAKIILDKSAITTEQKSEPGQSISNQKLLTGPKNESTKREKCLGLLLNEAETQEVQSVAQNNQRKNIKSDGFANANFNNGFTIIVPSSYIEKLHTGSEFSNMLGIKWTGNKNGSYTGNITKISGNPPITVKSIDYNLDALRAAGTTVFKSILEYVNGKKSGSASLRGTNDTIKSQQMNESYLREADEKLQQNDNDSNFDWSWENIKINMGAKEYLDRLFASVTDIKNGLDDGGNPSLISRVAKQTLATVASKWAAAFTDAADLGLEGIGLGWMMPLIKSGLDELKKEKPNKKYEGIEAWVRDPSFKEISKYFGSPKDFIEGAGTK